ncbi:hypothetical protein BKA65DRAFT_479916 [Rhexocercosporidium sp. MPI-PUGE-AT-0058]|nr:hypothetical protein BKA65DRAFT_479916 [Rhexocercosporidium sp. MPI-PUGE-AT-0058]
MGEMSSPFSTIYNNREMRYYYIFFILTLILLITILSEICLFANEHLQVNKWLVLQIFKLVFAATAFGATPWIAGLVCGLMVKWQDGRKGKEDLVVEEEEADDGTENDPGVQPAYGKVDEQRKIGGLTFKDLDFVKERDGTESSSAAHKRPE